MLKKCTRILPILQVLHHFILPATLFAIYLHFFGLNTLEKASEMDVQTVTRMTSSQSIKPPALTICPMGWKETDMDVMSLKDDLCNGTDSMDALKQCVNAKGFSLNEAVDPFSSNIGQHTEEKYHATNIDPAFWISSIVVPIFGICHTLIYPKPMDLDEFLMIVLKKNVRIYLHDPKFFVQRMDNFLVPFLDLDNPEGKNYRLIATTKKRLRRPGKFECIPDDAYNFQVDTEIIVKTLDVLYRGFMFRSVSIKVLLIELVVCLRGLLHQLKPHGKSN